MVPATVKFVREARSSSTNPLPTTVALSSTTMFSGTYDWEAMKTRVWGSHTPATMSPTTLVKPVQVGTATASPTTSRPDKPVQVDMASPTTSRLDKPMSGGTATTHLVSHVPTMMLATSEPVHERTSTQVGHTPTHPGRLGTRTRYPNPNRITRIVR